MNFREAFKIALQSLWANKLRSILTLLGVVIGVASVITVITLVNGTNKFVETKFTGYGADVFTLSKQPSVILSAEEFLKAQRRKNLSYEDYQAIAGSCKSCISTGALYGTTGKVVKGKQSSTDTSIRGVTWTMPPIQNLNVEEGRGFTPSDEEHNSHVCVVGADIIDNIITTGDPIGQEVRVDGQPYTIIGVGERQGKTLGVSQDNWVQVPITTYMRTYGTSKSIVIYVKAGTAPNALEISTGEARALLRARRHDAAGEPDSFEIATSDTFLSIWSSISATFEMVVVGLASISLVVGGVVIMNIMLVAVTERTREIGIRKALGAKRNDVMMQFIIESATMSLVGGMIGVFIGMIVAKLITVISGWPADVALWSVLVGLFVATAVGVFFGVYPARKAAMLDPIVALRSEL